MTNDKRAKLLLADALVRELVKISDDDLLQALAEEKILPVDLRNVGKRLAGLRPSAAPASRQAGGMKMKPPRYAQGQFSQNIPELIQHLRRLSAGMEADPKLTEPARYLRRAIDELETLRQAAFEVYQEILAANDKPRRDATAQSDEDMNGEAEWLQNLAPASPLKQ